jgi:eukaryotic translation initiation factor 2C
MGNTKGIQALATASLTSHFPARPGYGTQGKKIVVYANYFKIGVPNNLAVTRYNVEVKPEAKGRKLARIFQLLLGLPEFTGDIVSDMSSMVISKVPLNISDGYTTEIVYLAEGQDEPLERAQTYTIRVVAPLSIVVSDFQTHLCAINPSADFDLRAEFLQVLNVIFSHYPQTQAEIVTTGQNRHFSIDRRPSNYHNIQVLGGGLESLRGFYSSVRAATGGLLLNVNVSHNVFIQPDPLSVLYPKLGTGNKVTLQKKLKLIRVKVTHLPSKKDKKTNEEIPRIKTIYGLAHPEDGRREEHPPQIKTFGAGPQDVKFWLAGTPPAGTAKAPAKGKKPTGGLPASGYVTVLDYFKNSKQSYEMPVRILLTTRRIS